MTNEVRIKACFLRHPEWSVARVADSMSVRQEEVRALVGSAPQVAPSAPSGGNGKDTGTVDLSSVLKRYDVKAAILNELSTLPEGKLISEDELCKRTAGTDRNRFRRTCENNPDTFNPLRIKLKLDTATDGKWFWGKASDVAAALNIRDL
jgi:hypothetical protein